MFQPAKRPLTDWSTTPAMKAKAIAGRIGLQGIQTPVYLSVPVDDGWGASRESSAAPRDFSSPQSSWQPFPGASAPRRKPAEPPVDTPVDVESLGAPAPSTPGVHEFIHSVQFGIMPKRPDLPHPDDEILWVMKRMSCPYNQHWNATWSVKAVPSPSIVNPKTGGTLHPIQSIALTTTCFIACVSRRASAF